MSLFSQAKDLFTHSGNIADFVALETNITVKEKLKDHIYHKPFQILLLTGSPGVGKSYVVEKITEEIEPSWIYLQKFPFVTTISLLVALHEHFLPDVPSPSYPTREGILSSFREHWKKEHLPVVIVDEIQLYKNDELELIRMLSDTRVFRFIFVIHKLEKQDLLSQSYFTSRTWGKIELHRLTLPETKHFIKQKLIQGDLIEASAWIGNRQYDLLHRLARGNLRVLNKLCYTTFEISEYYEVQSPSLLADGTIPLRFIEMAALDVGVLHE